MSNQDMLDERGDVWCHAACLSIAEGCPGWDEPTAFDSPAMVAVRDLQSRLDSALAGESAALSNVAALYDAVKYVLNRCQTDPDLGYYLGWGTEAFHRLCVAEAAYLGEPLEEIEQRRRVDLQPDYRKRDPEVLVLRRRVEELQG